MKKKNSGCSTGLWVLFMTACVTATMLLGILKAVGALETTWLMAFLPMIIGAAMPVVVILFAILVGFVTGMFKMRDDDDED